MQGHLQAVDAVRAALVHGDLSGAKKANRDFLDHKVAFDLPGDWLTHVGAMGEAAVALDGATDLQSAARHAAEVASACGSCHDAVGAAVTLPLPDAPDPDDHAATENRRLQATWNALIAHPDGGTAPGAAEAASALVVCATCHAKAPG
jgi:cytochrome c553